MKYSTNIRFSKRECIIQCNCFSLTVFRWIKVSNLCHFTVSENIRQISLNSELFFPLYHIKNCLIMKLIYDIFCLNIQIINFQVTMDMLLRIYKNDTFSLISSSLLLACCSNAIISFRIDSTKSESLI